LTALALMLTFAIMSPTLAAVSHDALEPYSAGKISQRAFLERAYAPLRRFMLRQTQRRDLDTFARISGDTARRPAEPPPAELLPAFVVGELRSAFAIGLALYLPFIAIDLAVASILMGLGMFMLSPPVVSLPCKLLLFVMVDGWALVCGGVAGSFR
jgi:flagellar biosynthetic protein FliP